MKEYGEIKYPIAIGERYDVEIRKIQGLLEKLESRDVFEVTGRRFDGSIKTVARDLDTEIFELLKKIQYGEKSMSEKMREAVNLLNFNSRKD